MWDPAALNEYETGQTVVSCTGACPKEASVAGDQDLAEKFSQTCSALSAVTLDKISLLGMKRNPPSFLNPDGATFKTDGDVVSEVKAPAQKDKGVMAFFTKSLADVVDGGKTLLAFYGVGQTYSIKSDAAKKAMSEHIDEALKQASTYPNMLTRYDENVAKIVFTQTMSMEVFPPGYDEDVGMPNAAEFNSAMGFKARDAFSTAHTDRRGQLAFPCQTTSSISDFCGSMFGPKYAPAIQ